MAIDNSVGMFNENAGSIYNAREYRRLFSRMLMGADVRTIGGSATSGTGNGGVARAGDFAVTERGAGANMSVDVATGGAMVGGTESSTQGEYFVFSTATINVAITAADATNARIDIVGIRVRDSEYSGASNDAVVTVVTGTPAAVPAEPSLPANFLTLARVDVPAADTAIQNAQITDRRRRIAALGGSLVCTSSTRPSVGLWEGQIIYETDTDLLLVYSGTAWEHLVRQGEWNTYTPSLGGTSASLGNGTIAGRFQKVGRTVNLQIALTGGSTTNLSSDTLTLSLPASHPARDPGNFRAPIGVWVMFDTGVATYNGTTVIDHETHTANDRLALLYQNNFVSDANPIAGGFAATDELVVQGSYESTA